MDVRRINPQFVGEVRACDVAVRQGPADIAAIRSLMDELAVLVLKDQHGLDDDALLRFSEAFGPLHRSITTNRSDMERRLGRDALSDISNIDRDGAIVPPDDARRLQQRANLIWHTDNSFRRPAGLYTMLAARIVPPAGGETEFADARGAYEALPAVTKAKIDTLQVEHSLAHSRFLVGTDKVFAAEEAERFPATVQPLVRAHAGRRSLYIGSHAWRVVGWTYEDSQALLGELLAFATHPQFVYRHSWTAGDLVMWDNRTTLHRALPFDDVNHRRDLRRTSSMLEEDAPQLHQPSL